MAHKKGVGSSKNENRSKIKQELLSDLREVFLLKKQLDFCKRKKNIIFAN